MTHEEIYEKLLDECDIKRIDRRIEKRTDDLIRFYEEELKKYEAEEDKRKAERRKKQQKIAENIYTASHLFVLPISLFCFAACYNAPVGICVALGFIPILTICLFPPQG